MIKEKLYLLTYKGTLEGQSGESCGSKYVLDNACPVCGTGAKIIGNLFVKKIKGKRALIETLSGDFLIADELYNNLRLLNINIRELLPIVDFKTRQELPFYHLKTDFSFPKMRSDSDGVVTEDQCSTCLQEGYFDDFKVGEQTINRKYKYNYSDIKELLIKSDIFNTWEHFGKSNLVTEGFKVTRYARPRFIIKENIKKVLEDLKVKSLVFDEIYLLE